jgi:hypothetical protein
MTVFDPTIRYDSAFFAVKVSSAFYTFANIFPLILGRGGTIQ